MPLSSAVPSPARVRKILSVLLREYQDQDTGGLTRTAILELLRPLDNHLQSRLAYASGIPLVCWCFLTSGVVCSHLFAVVGSFLERTV
jgi:uncharacterized protein YwbE